MCRLPISRACLVRQCQAEPGSLGWSACSNLQQMLPNVLHTASQCVLLPLLPLLSLLLLLTVLLNRVYHLLLLLPLP